MTKIIHYCWFGGKPLPKLAKKCIKSWQKYLPDYKIIEWNESNVNLDECPFVRDAYKAKKWAFVADYARTKALYEMGGIYFDTDMEITKDISNLLNNETFLGVEDSGKIAVGVWFEKNPHSFISTNLLKNYQSFEKFDLEKINDNSIPNLITKIIEKCGFSYYQNSIQYLNYGIAIYPRDFFYPYSFDHLNNSFSDNTCMIHYYDASWISLKEKIELKMIRIFGRIYTEKLLCFYRKCKNSIKIFFKILFFPLIFFKRYNNKLKQVNSEYLSRINNTLKLIKKYQNKNYIVFYNKLWLGVTSATQELFDNIVDCGELIRRKDAKLIAKEISKTNIKQVIFSSLTYGESYLISYLKKLNCNLKIKIFWHGNNSQILDDYGFERNAEIINMYRNNSVNCVALCKKSLINFYKEQGIKVVFITNKVELKNNKIKYDTSDKLTIGIYAAKCDDWRKNMFASIAAVSLIPGACIDMVPLSKEAIVFANALNVKITGLENNLSRENLISRMALNKVNLYVTFSECSPMLPLESFELGVPCVTGNNNHYFLEGLLHKYTVVENEENVMDIKNKILNCIKYKDKINAEYQKFKTLNLENSKKNIKEFLDM